MPFKKSEDTPKFYTGYNLLKNYWKTVIEHINSSPAQIALGVTWMMFLCAETEETRNIGKLALVAHYGRQLFSKGITDLDGLVDDAKENVASTGSAILDQFKERI